MDDSRKRREPLLWWIAGADARVLAECPRGDQVFVQHLGISLIGAFAFVFAISTISLVIAFPDLSGTNTGFVLVPSFAFIIALMIFLIDRLFIQYDWEWQAHNQRRALAQANWETRSLEDKIRDAVDKQIWINQVSRLTRSSFFILRITLSTAIGLTIATFLELAIYKNEIRNSIQHLHYEDNRSTYDEITLRTDALDDEIAKARHERDRLVAARVSAEDELSRLELAPPTPPSDRKTPEIDKQIADLKGKIVEEEIKSRRYNEDMIAEMRGTLINPGNSGVWGMGPKYLTAQDLKGLSEKTIADLHSRLDDLDKQKEKLQKESDMADQEARAQAAEQKRRLRLYVNGVTVSLSTAQQKLSLLEDGRDTTIAAFVSSVKQKPGFIPLSFGVASQFRALRFLYRRYGATFEMYMIKLLIMMLEMTPVLQKVFLSPTTLYAVKLEAARRSIAYEHFNEELKLRQAHLRAKAASAYDEEVDGQVVRRAAQRNVTSLPEARGTF